MPTLKLRRQLPLAALALSAGLAVTAGSMAFNPQPEPPSKGWGQVRRLLDTRLADAPTDGLVTMSTRAS